MALHYQIQSWVEIGSVNAEQMAEVDRRMVEDLGIEVLQMMENAGANLAQLAVSRFQPRTVAVYVGSGGNGGGGLVAARHLANHGVDVSIVLSGPAKKLTAAASHQLAIVQKMGLPIGDAPVHAELGIDALVGYGLDGDLRGPTAELVRAIGAGHVEVLALDVPSGLDATSGRAGDPAVAATATLTLALPKVGLLESGLVGEMFVADISVPPSVYDDMGVGPAPDFSRGPLVRLI